MELSSYCICLFMVINPSKYSGSQGGSVEVGAATTGTDGLVHCGTRVHHYVGNETVERCANTGEAI